MGTLVGFLQSGLCIFHVAFGNWGLAIMALTGVLRLILLPLQAIACAQQQKLQRIKPELDLLFEKWKRDPARLISETSRLKKKEGVKSWLIVLSVIIQVPIFLAMYRAITSTQLIKNDGFAWLSNLALPDRIFLLPLVVAFSAFWQQNTAKKSAVGSAPTGLQFMPVLSFIFMMSLPSGVVLYYATSSVLQLAGDMLVKRWII